MYEYAYHTYAYKYLIRIYYVVLYYSTPLVCQNAIHLYIPSQKRNELTCVCCTMRLFQFLLSLHLLFILHAVRVVGGAFLSPNRHGASLLLQKQHQQEQQQQQQQPFATTMTMNMKMLSAPQDRDDKVQQVLEFARNIGPVGSLASEEDRQKLVSMSQELVEYSDPNPSEIPLRGTHYLVYSASEGGSSGRLGPTPFYGKVKQEFHNDNVTFINSVSLGPLEASLRATRSIKNEATNLVKFHQTTIKIFGQTVVDKEIKGGGFWKYLFMGKILDKDGTVKLVRIMETPSLFVLEQPL